MSTPKSAIAQFGHIKREYPMHWLDKSTVRLLQATFALGSPITISLVMQHALEQNWAEESAWLEAHQYPVKVEQTEAPADDGATRHVVTLRFIDPDHAIAFKLRFH